uniref:Superfamily Ggeo03-1 n=1 Tax=Conus magus TaxID=6492 RepID=A0A5P8I0W6_CONMA|nr:superfamily Ggeo03-1 [Conus magus]
MGSMNIYLCLAFLLLLASTIVDSGVLDKIETARTWRRDEGQCDQCSCATLKNPECVSRMSCITCHSTNWRCNGDDCFCTQIHGGFCVTPSECKVEEC